MHAENPIYRWAPTFEGGASPALTRSVAALGCALVSAAFLVAYSNHFQNGFHFDDAHTIENNAAIRELRNIPLFFRDATTFSCLPANQSYRPLVSTLFAIDYRLAGGLKPFWFHLSTFIIFVGLTLLLAFIIYRLLESVIPSRRNYWVALASAAWYGLSPANADTVNYVIASADVISTAGVLASFACYLAFPQLRRSFFYGLPAALGILAKPPAGIFAVLFAIFYLLFNKNIIKGEEREGSVATWLSEIVPPFLLCGTILLFSQYMTPHSWVSGAASARNYLITQPYVALLYLKTFFWPSGISADYDLAPFTTTNDVHFWIGFAFIASITAGSIVACIFKTTRVIGFGLVWFLVALLPTSLFPLAEVMNDHRALLPYVGLVIAGAGAAALLVNREERFSVATKVTAASMVMLFLAASGYATWQRNKVWKTEESLWHDVVIKSPRNARGLMNYGTVLMAKGDLIGALSYFNRAQILAPNYPVLRVNLAIANVSMNQLAQGEQYFQEALRLAPLIPDSYTYYARWLFSQGRIIEARQLVESALTCSSTDLFARQLLAQVTKSSTAETPESYLALSARYYRSELYTDSIVASQNALALRPGYAEAWNNMGASYNRLGEYNKGIEACQNALSLKPHFDLARNNLRYARAMLKP